MDQFKSLVIFLMLLAAYFCFAEDQAHQVIKGEKKDARMYFVENFVTFFGFWQFQNTTIDTKTYKINSEIDEKIEEFFADDIPTISFLPIQVGKVFPNLKKYYILECSVKEISAENFKNLKKLKALCLRKNEISSIDKDAFKDLVALEKLHLGRNQIASLHEEIFFNNQALKELTLNKNRLESVPANLLRYLRELVYVQLSGNKLKTLDSTFFASNLKLEYIELGWNQIEQLHAGTFKGLRELSYVNLYGNKCIDNQYETLPGELLPTLASDLKNCSQTPS